MIYRDELSYDYPQLRYITVVLQFNTYNATIHNIIIILILIIANYSYVSLELSVLFVLLTLSSFEFLRQLGRLELETTLF